MGVSYIEQFHMLKTIASDDKQNIFIGTAKEDTTEMVIINILKDKTILLPHTKKKIKSSLQSLLHIEETENEVILVTKFVKGVPLGEYLSQSELERHDRMVLIFQYLKGITTYGALENNLINMLVDESQLIVDKGMLHFNDLIINNEMIKAKVGFESIIKKIGSLVGKIYNSSSEFRAENVLYDRISQFGDDLENNRLPLNHLDDVFNAYKALYFNRTTSRSLKSFQPSILISGRKNKNIKGKNLAGKIAIGFATVALTVYAATAFHVVDRAMNLFIPNPTAYFEKIHIENGLEFINKSTAEGKNNGIKESQWEVYKDNQMVEEKKTANLVLDVKTPGEYSIVLKVQDQYGKWSIPYKEKVNISQKGEVDASIVLDEVETEKLESLKIVFDNTDSIFTDEAIRKSGKYALRLEGTNNESTQSITLEELKLDNNASLSLWMMSQSTKAIDIKIQGFRKGALHYEKSLSFRPSSSNSWEMLHINDNMGNLEEMKITLFKHESVLWIDDLEFSAYK